jgi:hypothetical protein
VPEHLRTKTQLADLDLPRIPGGEAVGYVHDRGPHGRKGDFDLYDLATSLPSPATAGQLQAARHRSESDGRRCAACGARPDQRPTTHRDPGENGAAALLCHPCLHIARLRETQHRIATERTEACHLAATWLAEDTAALVHAAPISPPPGPDGRPKHPLALAVGAFTPGGTLLYRATVRLNRSRNPIVPTDAVPAEEAFEALSANLTGRCVIEWSTGALKHLGGVPTFPNEPSRSAPCLFVLDRRVAAWRGQIDPHTYRLTTPPDPGRADLMALLIRRMAADHTTPDQT